MFALPASAVAPCLATVHFGYWLAWGGSLALSIALVLLMWTRWGHSQPLQKCAALSLLVHLILAFLTMTVRIVVGEGSDGGGSLGGPIHVRIGQDSGKAMTVASAVAEVDSNVAAPELLEAPEAKEEPAADAEPQATVEEAAAAPKPAVTETHSPDPTPTLIPDPSPAKANENVKSSTESVAASGTKDKQATSPKGREPSAAKQASEQPNAAKQATAAASDSYSLRNAPGRLSLIEGQGGNAKTEAAVVAALNWLASAQSNDGRWNANLFGAGKEQMVLGQDRGGAGRNADTGISALAVLAFLGAGHSHVNGQYRETVHRGLDFLLRSQ